MENLNATDIANALAAKLEIPKVTAKDAFGSIFETIGDTVLKGGRVSIHGFGTFSLKETAARKGRNPQTGEAIDIPAKKQVVFKAVPALKQTLASKAVKKAAPKKK